MRNLVLLPALLIFWAVSAVTAEYRLAPGDQVKVSFLGLPASEATSIIDSDGFARFPLLGAIEAAGLTIDEMQEAAQISAVGRRYSYLGPTGDFVSLDLDGFTAFAEIAGFRPIFVTGDVMRPGEVGFKPGKTLRAAIASAGGQSVLPGIGGPLGRARIEDITRLRILSHELALKEAALWRVEAVLNRDPDADEPSIDDRLVSQAAFIQVMALERERLDGALSAYNGRRERLLEELSDVEGLSKLLEEQTTMAETLIEADREELERVNELSERGLTQNNRVSASRRNFAISSSQLLEVLRDRNEGASKVSEIEAALDELDRDLRIDALDEKSGLLRERTEAEIRLRTLRRALGADGSTAMATLVDSSGNEVTVYRDGETISDASLDDPTFPGDVIDVRASPFN